MINRKSTLYYRRSCAADFAMEGKRPDARTNTTLPNTVAQRLFWYCAFVWQETEPSKVDGELVYSFPVGDMYRAYDRPSTLAAISASADELQNAIGYFFSTQTEEPLFEKIWCEVYDTPGSECQKGYVYFIPHIFQKLFLREDEVSTPCVVLHLSNFTDAPIEHGKWVLAMTPLYLTIQQMIQTDSKHILAVRAANVMEICGYPLSDYTFSTFSKLFIARILPTLNAEFHSDDMPELHMNVMRLKTNNDPEVVEEFAVFHRGEWTAVDTRKLAEKLS